MASSLTCEYGNLGPTRHQPVMLGAKAAQLFHGLSAKSAEFQEELQPETQFPPPGAPHVSTARVHHGEYHQLLSLHGILRIVATNNRMVIRVVSNNQTVN